VFFFLVCDYLIELRHNTNRKQRIGDANDDDNDNVMPSLRFEKKQNVQLVTLDCLKIENGIWRFREMNWHAEYAGLYPNKILSIESVTYLGTVLASFYERDIDDEQVHTTIRKPIKNAHT
jgi:hypothetical protein